jgi:two-component system sensor histidine kinase VicK
LGAFAPEFAWLGIIPDQISNRVYNIFIRHNGSIFQISIQMSHSYNTEIVYGLDAIIERTLKRLSKANKKIDVCVSATASEAIVKAKPIFDLIVSLNKNGIKIRYITEITQQNLYYVKELMKTGVFRHMDEIKGNSAIVDGVDYQATAAVFEGEGPAESVLSTAKAFVDQQQFVFEMLWKKAIPASKRIREIEEGLKREFIETVQDKSEIDKIIIHLISTAVEVIDIILPTNNSFYKNDKESLFKLLETSISNNPELKLKILSDNDISAKSISLQSICTYSSACGIKIC